MSILFLFQLLLLIFGVVESLNASKNASDIPDDNYEPEWLPLDSSFGTVAAHAGYKPKDYNFGPVVPPIFMTATFEQDAPGKDRGFIYTRRGNPSRTTLEVLLAALDKGKHAVVFSSGMAAVSTVLNLLTSGDHVISMEEVYGGTSRLLRAASKFSNIVTEFVDLTNLDHFRKALSNKTKLVWIESPTNPALKVVDIAAVAKIAHEFSPSVLVAVDNTFLSPFFQRPLALGADIVMYSLTKYINGHSDLLMGAVVTSKDDIKERLSYLQMAVGNIPSAFDCFLVLRGVRTLHVRMPVHSKSAFKIAKFLAGHPKVAKVLHPGLRSHPQHQVALKQASGHSGVVSFYIKGDEGRECGSKFLQKLHIFSLAESLGGYESLAQLPLAMTHFDVPQDQRARLGITDTLIRLSIGLESYEDLITDIDQALNHTC